MEVVLVTFSDRHCSGEHAGQSRKWFWIPLSVLLSSSGTLILVPAPRVFLLSSSSHLCTFIFFTSFLPPHPLPSNLSLHLLLQIVPLPLPFFTSSYLPSLRIAAPFRLTCPSPSSLCFRRAVWRIFKSLSSTSITLKWFYTVVLGCRYSLPPVLLERDRLGHCSRSNPTRPKVPQWPNNYNTNRLKQAADPAPSQLMRCRIIFPLFLTILPCFVAGAYFA